MQSLLTAQTGRLDRHVRRNYLRLGPEASRHRVAFSLEEALRLSSLPGEEEGRIYCFRRVSLSGMDPEANRRVWIHAVGSVMEEIAAQALHGSHQFAGTSNAIYFHSREEALETLLRKALQEVEAGTENPPSWFSCSLLGTPTGARHAEQTYVILKELLHSANPAMSATLIFAALGEQSPSHLISVIPEEQFRAWIPSHDTAAAASEALYFPLPDRLRWPLHRAGAECGWAAPGTVWLAVQAILCAAPAAFHAAALVSRARSLLRELQAELGGAVRSTIATQKHSAGLRFDEDTESEVHDRSLPKVSPADRTAAPEHQDPHSPIVASALEKQPNPQVSLRAMGAIAEGGIVSPHLPAAPPLRGESTSGGRLFFLLHVLRHLEISALLRQYPALGEADFAGHILRSLIDQAKTPEDDPIRMCLPPSDSKFHPPEDLFLDPDFIRNAAPAGQNWRISSSAGSDALLRIWTLAVRRWCWRTASLTLADIVSRRGRVWLTRTDLDVTFPLSAVDVRIRRIGLDIDPGWVPWLGAFGKVVRFHYREGEVA